MKSRIERFEEWFGAGASDGERERLFEKDSDGNYKFMTTYHAWNSFLAGCHSEASIGLSQRMTEAV